VEAFEQEVQYRGQVLSDTQEAFDRGLVTQTDVDQAKLDVELNRYQKTIYALQALILENRAKALQL
jgi:outer membrane protein TolC